MCALRPAEEELASLHSPYEVKLDYEWTVHVKMIPQKCDNRRHCVSQAEITKWVGDKPLVFHGNLASAPEFANEGKPKGLPQAYTCSNHLVNR